MYQCFENMITQRFGEEICWERSYSLSLSLREPLFSLLTLSPCLRWNGWLVITGSFEVTNNYYINQHSSTPELTSGGRLSTVSLVFHHLFSYGIFHPILHTFNNSESIQREINKSCISWYLFVLKRERPPEK